MTGGPIRPSGSFWQYWAIAGMLVLTAAFWWSVEGLTLFRLHRPADQVADGLLRFSLLILTPALIGAWLAAPSLRRKLGDGGYWQMLGVIAAIWAGAVIISRIWMP